ncbi:response regulator [Virgibacillus sp. AGTR]|uniref:response regulator n=1 Tax=Virgibacillus TaxID=84406 RepID=UPI001964FF3F|nr:MULTISPECIES: response regulator [unclassified Virgibacillus]MCC2249996.1 response regulator [Virgibacillus sp. AGTR]MDY7044666.1 response regulator [Virgibacillus sp. M23]QRZ18150.1 response regulator [Virgibacillus sp. AGTR]
MIRVIIAEDDYRIANIHEKFLETISGIEVVGKALNGEQTLDMVSKTATDLILLDIYMPDMLGSDIMLEIRHRNPNIDFIMISAATETKIVGNVIRNGIFDYIIKPVKMERFIETIKRYKNMKQQLAAKNEVDQSFLDDYFGQKLSTREPTPKGIDPLTLEKVEGILHQVNTGITAEEMGSKVGASRTTARRYLEYLISINKVTAELEYGIVGRPERRYHLK